MSKRQNNVFWLHVLISLSILKQNYITDETNYITCKKASFDDTQTIYLSNKTSLSSWSMIFK